jgi:hypothetical protein
MAEAGIFSLATASTPALEPSQLSIQWAPGHETDHSIPTGDEVENAWSCMFTPPYTCMTWYLVKHRNNFTFANENQDPIGMKNEKNASCNCFSQTLNLLSNCLFFFMFKETDLPITACNSNDISPHLTPLSIKT